MNIYEIITDSLLKTDKREATVNSYFEIIKRKIINVIKCYDMFLL